MWRKLLRFRGDADGVAAIEVALALPFMVLLGAGLFEFGSLFYNFELIQTGVRDGARYLARVPDPVAAEESARNLAYRGTVDTSGAPRVSWWDPLTIQVSYKWIPNPVDPATGRRTYRGADPLRVVRVSTAFDYAGLGLLSNLGLGPFRVTASHEERYVGE